MRDIPITFGYGFGKICVTNKHLSFYSAYYFLSSAHSLIAGKYLSRVRDMMTTNDGNSKC